MQANRDVATAKIGAGAPRASGPDVSGARFLQPQDFGRIFANTFAIYVRNFRAISLIYILPLLPIALLREVYNNSLDPEVAIIVVMRLFEFMSFLLIFSGFWMMFWQIFYSFPFYITDVLNYEAFEFLETVDAWTIILITIPVTALVSKLKPVTAIILGFSIASLSWIIIGAGGTILAAIIGVAMFALGEATQAPRFYEYVSSLAPKDQVGTFMGFAFLPVAIGSFSAGLIADWLRSSYLQTDPPMMWYTLSGIGIISTILMIIYNRLVTK